MAQNTMYVSKNNSPQTTLTNEITATEQTIPVADISKLPAAPNIVSIGSGDNIELVYYAGISGSTLTGCVRGYHGTTASIWYEDTPVYRAYTSYDHDTFKSNIEDLATTKLDKTGNASSTTVTFTEAEVLVNPTTGDNQATLWGKILKLFNSTSGHDHDGTNSKKIAYANLTGTPFLDNAGAHNSIWRGASLGTSVTTAQWTAISNGTFENMYIGDYWTINSVVWRIWHFNYYYNIGDTNCTTNHVTIVPDTCLYNALMNTDQVVTGAYAGSKMRTTNLDTAKTTINNAFGSDHILNHRVMLANEVSGDVPIGWSWYDSTVELMTEHQVYGARAWGAPANNGYSVASQDGIFAAANLNHSAIHNRSNYWLQDVINYRTFSGVSNYGYATEGFWAATPGIGVRPYFQIIG